MWLPRLNHKKNMELLPDSPGRLTLGTLQFRIFLLRIQLSCWERSKPHGKAIQRWPCRQSQLSLTFKAFQLGALQIVVVMDWIRDQIVSYHFMEKAREFQKDICFIDYTKAFDCVDHIKLWKILHETGIPDHLTCLLRNLYVGQELDMEQLIGSKLGKESAAAAAKSLQSRLTLQPHRRQLTRLPLPWDSPGQNTGVGCHFLLQCMKSEKWKWSHSVVSDS